MKNLSNRTREGLMLAGSVLISGAHLAAVVATDGDDAVFLFGLLALAAGFGLLASWTGPGRRTCGACR